MRKAITKLIRDENASAAEFALVLPVAMAFLLGIIDGGRYMWEINRAEKATQAGARAAAVTTMIPSGVIDYSFSIENGVPQGSSVPPEDFPGITCIGSDSGPSCSWDQAPAETIDGTGNADAFTLILARMRNFLPGLNARNVEIRYSHSGLGFAGDPNGPDVAPVITVSLVDMQFEPILTTVFGLTWRLPSASYSLTQEDGQGTCFEESC